MPYRPPLGYICFECNQVFHSALNYERTKVVYTHQPHGTCSQSDFQFEEPFTENVVEVEAKKV